MQNLVHRDYCKGINTQTHTLTGTHTNEHTNNMKLNSYTIHSLKQSAETWDRWRQQHGMDDMAGLYIIFIHLQPINTNCTNIKFWPAYWDRWTLIDIILLFLRALTMAWMFLFVGVTYQYRLCQHLWQHSILYSLNLKPTTFISHTILSCCCGRLLAQNWSIFPLPCMAEVIEHEIVIVLTHLIISSGSSLMS